MAQDSDLSMCFNDLLSRLEAQPKFWEQLLAYGLELSIPGPESSILSHAREAGSPLKATAQMLTRGHPKNL